MQVQWIVNLNTENNALVHDKIVFTKMVFKVLKDHKNNEEHIIGTHNINHLSSS